MNTNNNSHHPTALYICHGAGPLPLLGEAGHHEMIETLKALATKLSKPSAIILISAHWEASKPTLTHGARPPLIYDYYGFPEAAYSIQYPASGAPDLAHSVASLLNDNGIASILDDQRGFDHGMFVPLKIMYPEADIPCIQLSLIRGLNPRAHIKLGETLAGLGQENVLVLGSGFSFHNIQAHIAADKTEIKPRNAAFEQWLIDTCTNLNLTEKERTERLENWETAPYARFCHPREEHLLPLHVCYGVAKEACQEYFELTVLGIKTSVYLWLCDSSDSGI